MLEVAHNNWLAAMLADVQTINSRLAMQRQFAQTEQSCPKE